MVENALQLFCALLFARFTAFAFIGMTKVVSGMNEYLNGNTNDPYQTKKKESRLDEE